MEIQKGEVYIYRNTGKAYEVEGLIMFKSYDPEKENGWSKSVMYRPVVPTPMQDSLYARTLEEFKDKFFKASDY